MRVLCQSRVAQGNTIIHMEVIHLYERIRAVAVLTQEEMGEICSFRQINSAVLAATAEALRYSFVAST